MSVRREPPRPATLEEGLAYARRLGYQHEASISEAERLRAEAFSKHGAATATSLTVEVLEPEPEPEPAPTASHGGYPCGMAKDSRMDMLSEMIATLQKQNQALADRVLALERKR